jgi:tetratricopeptide (TPR) repeat protein
MNRKQLNALFALASVGLSAGCASGWPKSLVWSRPENGSDSTAEYADDSSPSKMSSLLSRNPDAEKLSPEFKAAQKNFKNPEKSLLAWARYQEDIGEYAEARKKYRELQIAYPDNLEASVGLARIDILTGRTRQAEEQLSELASRYPKNGDLQVELGSLYSRNEDYPKAIRAYERACEINPKSEAYQYELGLALVKFGQFDEGLSHLAFAVGDAAAHYNIGYILHEQGDDENAVEWFRNALEMHPDKQTAERAQKMLAQLQPAEQLLPNEAVARANSARSASQHRTRSVADDTIPMVRGESGRTPATHSSDKLPMVDETSVVSTSSRRTQAQQGMPLPPASDSSVLPYVKTPVVSNAQPVRSVSWSPNQAAASQTMNGMQGDESSSGSGNPPQWNGPSRRTAQTLLNSEGVQSLPSWRARNDQ